MKSLCSHFYSAPTNLCGARSIISHPCSPVPSTLKWEPYAHFSWAMWSKNMKPQMHRYPLWGLAHNGSSSKVGNQSKNREKGFASE